ncbi:MAG: SDR family oxidoreductase [Sphingomonadales bacterium]
MTASPTPSLSGHATVIAGGTSGINFGIAEAFAEAGAKVFVISRSADKVDAAVAALSRLGDAAGATADVRDYDAVEAAIGQAAERFGALDCVVSGAAGNFIAKAAEMSPRAFRTVVDIDLIGTYHVARAAYPHLRRPGASLIAISAPQATVPLPFQAHVCAAKAGVEMLIKALAQEWGPEGIRANALTPGAVAGTEGMERLAPTPEAQARVTRAIALRRFADRREIADVAVFLASDASRYVTGAVVAADGGLATVPVGG